MDENTLTVNELINKINSKEIAIPQFQREFVWNNNQAVELLDSLCNDYFIGLILVWPTNDKAFINNWLEYEPKDYIAGNINYVIDGQQRVTTIYALFEGKTLGKIDPSKIFIEFNPKELNKIKFTTDPYEGKDNITFQQFIDQVHNKNMPSIKDVCTQFIDELSLFSKKMKITKKVDIKYLENSTKIDKVIEQFSRMNVQGKSLSAFDIFDSLQYVKTKNSISDNYVNKIFGFYKAKGKISRMDIKKIILNTALLVISQKQIDSSKTKTLKLTVKNLSKMDNYLSKDFIKKITNSVSKAFSWIIGSILPDKTIKLLPSILLVGNISFLIHEKIIDTKNDTHIKLVKDYFIKFGILQLNSKSTSGQVVSNIKELKNAISNESEKFGDYKFELKKDDILEKARYGKSDAFSVGIILALSLNHKFIDYNSNKEVDFDGIGDNSIHYDHIFPKSKRNIKTKNSIANIAFITQETNLSKSDTEPKEYFCNLNSSQSQIDRMLESQFIDYKMLGNDKEFIDHRALMIKEKIKEKW